MTAVSPVRLHTGIVAPAVEVDNLSVNAAQNPHIRLTLAAAGPSYEKFLELGNMLSKPEVHRILSSKVEDLNGRLARVIKHPFTAS